MARPPVEQPSPEPGNDNHSLIVGSDLLEHAHEIASKVQDRLQDTLIRDSDDAAGQKLFAMQLLADQNNTANQR